MKVKFLPMNIELEIQPDQSVMNLAHENNVPIMSVCNGMPSCAECRVKLVEGEHNVLPPSAKELSLIGTGHFIDQRRLSCQLICFGDITIDLSEQVEKASEGKVNKKFLQRAQKERPEDSHAAEGILIEQDQEFQDIAESKDDRGSATDKVIGQADKEFYGKHKVEAKSSGDKKPGGGGSGGQKRKRNNRRRRGGPKGKGGGNQGGDNKKSGGPSKPKSS